MRILNGLRFVQASLLLTVSVTLVSCAFQKDKDAGKTKLTTQTVVDDLKREKSEEAANGMLSKENVSVSFVEQPTPNAYLMVVSWPATIRNVTFRINDGTPQIKNNADRAEFAVNGDEVQIIEMVAYGTVSPAPLSALRFTAHSPKDYVVDKIVNMNKDHILRGNRLFMMPEGRFATNGYDLKISVNKIQIANDERASREETPFITLAKIVTHTPGTIAKSKRDLQGSVVTINAKEAYGELRIAMIGVNGQQGQNGNEIEKVTVPLPNRAPGDPAASKRGSRSEESPDTLGAMGTGRGGFDNARQATPGVCIVQPGNGAQGEKGSKGISGGKGDQGGNAGTLVLSIENSANLRVEVRQKVGEPGKGGPGGDGFPGQLGGLPGHQTRKCQAATQGPQGPTGDQGDSGRLGDSGDSVNIPRTSTQFRLLDLPSEAVPMNSLTKK